jgi:hypothetical protein
MLPFYAFKTDTTCISDIVSFLLQAHELFQIDDGHREKGNVAVEVTPLPHHLASIAIASFNK